MADKTLLKEHFRPLQPAVSELTFANLYLFRHVHQYALSLFNGSLTIFGTGYDGMPYFMPPLSGNRGETTCTLLDLGNTLYGADEQFVAEYLTGRNYEVISDRDNDDYLYLRSELAELPGKRFHKKKNRINYFTSRYKHSVETFSGKHLESALQFLDQYQEVHGDDRSPSQVTDTAATREGLLLADELGLSGVVILTEKGVSAFALGEQLNDFTAVCLFEKGDPYLEGVAQLVNREYSRFQPAGLTYINREQDLGEIGLRAAKSSYHPAAMARKFRVMAVK